MVGMNLILNFWNRDFFNAIQAYDVTTSVRLLWLYVAQPGGLPMPGFMEIVARLRGDRRVCLSTLTRCCKFAGANG